jgi:hypothetical protein
MKKVRGYEKKSILKINLEKTCAACQRLSKNQGRSQNYNEPSINIVRTAMVNRKKCVKRLALQKCGEC